MLRYGEPFRPVSSVHSLHIDRLLSAAIRLKGDTRSVRRPDRKPVPPFDRETLQGRLLSQPANPHSSFPPVVRPDHQGLPSRETRVYTYGPGGMGKRVTAPARSASTIARSEVPAVRGPGM